MSRKPKRKYPHMLDEDIKVFDAYLAAHGNKNYHYAYDVKVGRGITPDPRLNDVMKQFSVDITKKRIDCIVTMPDKIQIIEVKVNAGLMAISQLISYPILYNATFNPVLPLESILVARHLLTDVEMLLKVLQIPYFLFPELPLPPPAALTNNSMGSKG